MTFSTDELLAFVTVVDSGSITAAAEQLGQTTSGVSRALSRLEQRLAATLLQRTTRRLSLTEDGALFLDGARTILRAMAQAEETLAVRRNKLAGRLRVDAASPFMLHCVVPLMAEFTRLYPDIRLELTSHERNVDLLEQRTDIALRIGTLADSSLHARVLGTSQVRLLASPAYLAAHGEPQDVAALAQHRLLGFTDPEVLNHWPLRLAGAERLKIVPDLAASSGETLRHLALAGLGIVALSAFMSDGDIRAGRLKCVLPALLSEHRQTISAVYYRDTALSARVSCFIEFMAQRWHTELDPM